MFITIEALSDASLSLSAYPMRSLICVSVGGASVSILFPRAVGFLEMRPSRDKPNMTEIVPRLPNHVAQNLCGLMQHMLTAPVTRVTADTDRAESYP
jgi:hypothetical protein